MNELQEYRFSIKFDGGNAIPLDTLCTVLIEFNKLSEFATAGQKKCNYSVVANRPGSFETELIGRALIGASVFWSQNGQYIKSVLDTIKTWFDIKKHLKGESPKNVKQEEGKIHVENQSGEVEVYDMRGSHFFENAVINGHIIVLGNALKDSPAEAFSLLTEDKHSILHCAAEDFPYLSTGEIRPIESDLFISKVSKATLFVKKFITRGDSRWEFYYTKTFQASILDKEWLARFQNGEIQVVAGVCLIADFMIETEKDMDGMPIDNTAKYYVTKVYDVKFPYDGDQMAM